MGPGCEVRSGVRIPAVVVGTKFAVVPVVAAAELVAASDSDEGVIIAVVVVDLVDG